MYYVYSSFPVLFNCVWFWKAISTPANEILCHLTLDLHEKVAHVTELKTMIVMLIFIFMYFTTINDNMFYNVFIPLMAPFCYTTETIK